jgi:hypothetical protein
MTRTDEFKINESTHAYALAKTLTKLFTHNESPQPFPTAKLFHQSATIWSGVPTHLLLLMINSYSSNVQVIILYDDIARICQNGILTK